MNSVVCSHYELHNIDNNKFWNLLGPNKGIKRYGPSSRICTSDIPVSAMQADVQSFHQIIHAEVYSRALLIPAEEIPLRNELSYGGLFLFWILVHIRIHLKIKILFKSCVQVESN